MFRTLSNIYDGTFSSSSCLVLFHTFQETFLTFLTFQEYLPKWSFLALYFSSFSRSNFSSSKSKKNPLLKSLSYFHKWNFLAPSLKNFLYFRRELAISKNQKFILFLFKYKRKRKTFLILFLIKKQNFLS